MRHLQKDGKWFPTPAPRSLAFQSLLQILSPMMLDPMWVYLFLNSKFFELVHSSSKNDSGIPHSLSVRPRRSSTLPLWNVCGDWLRPYSTAHCALQSVHAALQIMRSRSVNVVKVSKNFRHSHLCRFHVETWDANQIGLLQNQIGHSSKQARRLWNQSFSIKTNCWNLPE